MSLDFYVLLFILSLLICLVCIYSFRIKKEPEDAFPHIVGKDSVEQVACSRCGDAQCRWRRQTDAHH